MMLLVDSPGYIEVYHSRTFMIVTYTQQID